VHEKDEERGKGKGNAIFNTEGFQVWTLIFLNILHIECREALYHVGKSFYFFTPYPLPFPLLGEREKQLGKVYARK
jgi:hypothetical protein